jgi:ribonuclease HI
LVDLTFVPRVHNGMGLRGVDDSLFPIIAPRLLGEVLGELQRPTAIYTDGSKTKGLVGIGIFLDDRDSYRFRLPGHCGIFTAEMCAIHIACDLVESKPMGAPHAYIILTDSLTSIEGLKSTGISYQTNDILFRTRRSLRYLVELGYDISLMWIPSHVGIQGNKRADKLANEGSTSGTLFQDQTGLTTVNMSDIYTRVRTRLLTEWQERWNDSEMGLNCYSIVL